MINDKEKEKKAAKEHETIVTAAIEEVGTEPIALGVDGHVAKHDEKE